VCEHVFVPQKGSLHGQFQRAVERRHLLSAETAARDLPRLSLSDALALLLLIAEQDPERFGRAAARWHARFALEARTLDLRESQLALAAIAAMGVGDTAGTQPLRDLGRRYRIPNLEAAFRYLG
jgi:hypothetical protein